MPAYDSQYTGQQMDTAIARYLSFDTDTFVTNTGLNTTLEDYLTASTAASTYLTISDAANTYVPLKTTSDTGVFLRGDNTWSNILTSDLTVNQRLQIGGTTVSSLSSAWGPSCVVGADGTNKAIIGYVASSTNGVVFGGHNSALTEWAPVNLSGAPIYFRENETLRAKILDGCLSLYPANNGYREGLRIHMYNTWSDLILCGADNSGDSGTSANSWFFGNNSGNLYITKNGSTSGSAMLWFDSRWHTSHELVISDNKPSGSFRAICGNYGIFWRNDGNDSYWLLTNSGDQLGSWNSLRPFRINNASGVCYVTTSSDIRYKNILNDMPDNEAYNLLSNVRIINYTYKTDNDQLIHNGIIAQELKKELLNMGIKGRPYLVFNFNGNYRKKNISQNNYLDELSLEDEENGRYAIDYGQLTPVLWKGWQIHEKIIRTQQQEINELREKLNKISLKSNI